VKQKKRIPKFGSEDQERSFWAARDSSSYIDWSKGEHVRFGKLNPSGHQRSTSSLAGKIKIHHRGHRVHGEHRIKHFCSSL
jgi:hypothetical protein